MTPTAFPERHVARRRLFASALAGLLVLGGLPWLSGPLTRLMAPAPAASTGAAAHRADGADGTVTRSGPVGQPRGLAPEGEPSPVGSPDAPLDDAALFGSGDVRAEPRGASGRDADDIIDEATGPASSSADPKPSGGDEPPTPAGPTIDAPTLVRAASGSLLVGLLTALVATLVGGLLGLSSGYRGGLVERIAVRGFADGLDALPQFVVLVTAVALYRDLAGTEGDALLVAVGVLIGLVNSTQVLLVVHHQTRLIASRKYVIAARLMGWSTLRVVRHKILPHLRHELIIPFTQLVIWGVFVETALSYLGFGPSSTGSTLGAQLHRIDPFTRAQDLAPAILMCLMTVGLAAALRALGDAIDALYVGAPREEGP